MLDDDDKLQQKHFSSAFPILRQVCVNFVSIAELRVDDAKQLTTVL